MEEIYYEKNGNHIGPIKIKDVTNHTIYYETLVWHEEMKDWTKAKNIVELTPYLKVMRILDFISGMTDLFALKLYRKLRGIEI